MQYVERNWFCFEPRHHVDTHFSCSMHRGMSDDMCGPAQQLSLCIVGRSTCLCFPCGPIQLSVAFVRPSKHVLVVLGTVVEIVSILAMFLVYWLLASRSHIQPIQLPITWTVCVRG